MTLFFIPLAMLIFMCLESFVRIFSSDQQVFELTRLYLKGTIPAMWFVGIQDLQKRWLSIMKITHVNTVATTIGCLIHLWVCYFFVIEKEWGIEGLGWACYTSAIITTFIMLVHTFLVP